MKDSTRFHPLVTVLVVLGSTFAATETRAVMFQISSVPGAGITFTGSGATATYSFFADGDGNSFQIDGVSGGGSLVGYRGTFEGTWTVGPVTTVNLVPLVETAPVSGIGKLIIHGPGGDDLTSDVIWTEASSLRVPPSPAVVGLHGHLTHFDYSGTDPDLLAFSNGGSGAEYGLAFTFDPTGLNLKDLVGASNKPKSTVFSGQLVGCTCPDTGTTCLLLGTSLIGLGGLRWNAERKHL